MTITCPNCNRKFKLGAAHTTMHIVYLSTFTSCCHYGDPGVIRGSLAVTEY